jgi:CSLREA domain-containing protein
MKKIIIFTWSVFFLMLLSVSNSATFMVTKTADTNDGTCDDDCSLREAIIAANVASGADVITLPAATYILSIAGMDENAAATGDLDITDDLTISGADTSNTIIDGGAIDRVFDIYRSTANVNISAVTITNGLVTDDTGGGLQNKGVLMLDHVTVTGNVVNGTDAYAVGGGIRNGGETTVTNSTISNNQADRGGGIFNAGSAILDLRDTTINGNTARVGGGLQLYGTAVLTNATVSDNSSSGVGGGLALYDAAVTLINCTVASNSSGGNNALTVWGDGTTFTLKHTILANSVGNCYVNYGGSIKSDGYNLDSDGSCGLAGPGDLSNMDPLLGPLQDNGGPTHTHALLTGSPAIDAGDNVGCPSTDQRGIARPKDGDSDCNAVCDIGAYEFVLPVGEGCLKTMPAIPLLLLED